MRKQNTKRAILWALAAVVFAAGAGLVALTPSGQQEVIRQATAQALLQEVGLDEEKGNRKVVNLSGGEQQRVGIARAISHDADITIADEPTGNLDGDTRRDILRIFTKLAHEKGECVIIVTHSKQVTRAADVMYSLQDGRLVELRRK